MSVRVLIVDDSAVVRVALVQALSKDPGIEVVDAVPDPFIARDRIMQLRPDVLTLDMEMPGMDGLTFLRRLMRYRPMPVVVVSSHTPTGSALAFDAIEAGAVSVICKPGRGYSLSEMSTHLARSIKEAAVAKVAAGRASPRPASTQALLSGRTERWLIAIGASTGGPAALREILTSFPSNAPPVVLVQHMARQFTTSFAAHLDQQCSITVREARDGDAIESGRALIAPGNQHLLLRRRAGRLVAVVKGGPRVRQHRPSVDVLFKSLVAGAAKNVLGVLLTGMGADGADGLLALRDMGAYTIAQDEQTSVVFGMPAEAARRGGACEVLALDKIGPALLARVEAGAAQGG